MLGGLAVLALALSLLAPSAQGGRGKPKPKPRPNLIITNDEVKGPQYVFSDEGGTLTWKATARNKGKATSKKTRMDLVLVPSRATKRQTEAFRYVLDSRKVPALLPNHFRRVSGSGLLVTTGGFPLGSYWVFVCVQKNRCNYTGRHLYVINRTWTGTVNGSGGTGGIAKLEKWSNLGPVSLNFDKYRGHGVFSYTFLGTVKWTDDGVNLNGCRWSGTGLKQFDETTSGPGIVLRYDDGDYRGVVGSLEDDFYTILISPIPGGFCGGGSSTYVGPVYEDFLTIRGKQALNFDQDRLRGSYGSGIAESAKWNWNFGSE
jgi:hypothetical protein